MEKVGVAGPRGKISGEKKATTAARGVEVRSNGVDKKPRDRGDEAFKARKKGPRKRRRGAPCSAKRWNEEAWSALFQLPRLSVQRSSGEGLQRTAANFAKSDSSIRQEIQMQFLQEIKSKLHLYILFHFQHPIINILNSSLRSLDSKLITLYQYRILNPPQKFSIKEHVLRANKN